MFISTQKEVNVLKYTCSECGSANVETIESARFDPNNGYVFIERCEIHHHDWCKDCDCEVILKSEEVEDVNN
jgi:rRNA maturation protein Nop10